MFVPCPYVPQQTPAQRYWDTNLFLNICSAHKLIRQSFLKEVITLWISEPHPITYLSVSGREHLKTYRVPCFVCSVSQKERRTNRHTLELAASSWCMGMLEGLVMDLQNLQIFLSEEQLPRCIMDKRDEGIRVFMLNNKELDWFYWGERERVGGVYWLTSHQEVIQHHN